ncbi:DNA cytosine methyltransferase [Helicobacter sp. 23-1048]
MILLAGGGGNWLKLKKTKFKTIFANDIKQSAKTAWVTYFSKSKQNADKIFFTESIVDLVKAHKNGAKIFPNNIDILTGGFPCQDFSIAGKRLGFDSQKNHNGSKIEIDAPTNENRGQLYIWMREVIAITRPKIFIAENVKGLTNLKNAKEIIERDFANICNGGYIVISAKVLQAADYGVPQSRERVIFFGFQKNALTKKALSALAQKHIPLKYDPYPPPTHAHKRVTCAEVLSDLNEPENEPIDKSQMAYSKAKYMGGHCQGQSEINMQSVALTIRAEHHGNIEFRRLSAENGGKNVGELAQGLKQRRLSVRECARLQSFPNDYEFILDSGNKFGSLSASEAYKLIGNAVPPLLAYHIAKRLETNWELYFGGKNDSCHK